MSRREQKGKYRETTKALELKQASLMDDIEEFENYRIEVLEKIRNDRKAGLSHKEIMAKYQPEVQLRQLTIALAEPDAGKALAAIKDLRDRDEGKAIERQEHTHRLEKLPDEQLDALLLSELAGVKEKSVSKLN